VYSFYILLLFVCFYVYVVCCLLGFYTVGWYGIIHQQSGQQVICFVHALLLRYDTIGEFNVDHTCISY